MITSCIVQDVACIIVWLVISIISFFILTRQNYYVILKDGIIKTSVISRDGREFNLRYITGLEIVSLLKDEYSQFIDSPFNIRIESEKA